MVNVLHLRRHRFRGCYKNTALSQGKRSLGLVRAAPRLARRPPNRTGGSSRRARYIWPQLGGSSWLPSVSATGRGTRGSFRQPGVAKEARPQLHIRAFALASPVTPDGRCLNSRRVVLRDDHALPSWRVARPAALKFRARIHKNVYSENQRENDGEHTENEGHRTSAV